MSNWIKLRRVVGYEEGSKIARFNADEIQFYYADTDMHRGNEINVTKICFNKYMVSVLETPQEVDNAISSPLTNKLAKWSENE